MRVETKRMYAIIVPTPQVPPARPARARRRLFVGEVLRAGLGSVCNLGGAGGCLVADDHPPRIVALPPASEGKLCIDLRVFEELNAVGGSIRGRPAGSPVTLMIVRSARNGVVVSSATCTHSGFPLAYNGLNASLDCGCHGSSFELDGKIINGPANAPLKIFPAIFDGRTITVTLEQAPAAPGATS